MLNKKLIVKNVMLDLGKIPIVENDFFLKEVIDLMNETKLGCVCIVNKKNVLKGIFTDGDLRRLLIKNQKPFSAFFTDNVFKHCTKNPISILKNKSLKYAVNIMEKKSIWDLPVVDKNKKLVGLLHLHNAIKTILK